MFRAQIVTALACLLLVMPAPEIWAAGLFDGTWEGVGEPTRACSDTAKISFSVKDSAIAEGLLTGPRGNGKVSGDIKADGSAVIAVGTLKFRGDLKFDGDSFAGKVDTFCGPRYISGKRAQKG